VPKVEFYFDYLSPYAYLAHSQIRRLGVDVVYRPFDVRRVMEIVGNVPTSVICKAKNRYIQADLRRWAAHYGTPLQRHPDVLEMDTRRLLRATLCAAESGPVGELVTALFGALWGGPQPLHSAADVADIARRTGADASGIERDMDAETWALALEKATQEAADRGVFGAPCMFVGDEMFFGNDRLDFLKASLEAAA
jgi:2-hydroxychromene-2-carboxylate isomerase